MYCQNKSILHHRNTKAGADCEEMYYTDKANLTSPSLSVAPIYKMHKNILSSRRFFFQTGFKEVFRTVMVRASLRGRESHYLFCQNVCRLEFPQWQTRGRRSDIDRAICNTHTHCYDNPPT
jgi:hypothetical protein